jgi:hypothetical protein
MTLHTALIALLLQAAPPPAATTAQAPKATVAGVVVNASGEALPNIRVSLGKLNVNLGAFTQFIVGERPPVEMTITADAFATITEGITAELQAGAVPPEFANQAAALQAVPLADIHEIIVSPSGSVVVVPKSAPPITTDERGRFVFNDVEPGTYKLMFSGSGYAKQDYGQRTAGGGVPMTLTPGQSKTDIVMRMMAVAAVSGRIRDAAGQAVAGVSVQLFRFAYDETGQKKVQRVTATRTDDRGDYRMYYLSPGRYYMSAGNQPGENQEMMGFSPGLEGLMFGTGYSTPNRVVQNYALMYYPGVASENAATPLDVQSGADLRGIDLLVSPQQLYRVRGRVVDSRTGQPPPTVNVSMNVQNPDPLAGGIMFSPGMSGANYRLPEGTFEMQNVSAGTYTINASIPNPPQTRPLEFQNMSPAERNVYIQSIQAAELVRPKASATVNVVNADVDGVLLQLGVSSSITGRMRVESTAPAAGALDFIRVQLRGAAPLDPLSGGGAQPRPVAADGTFRIDNVWPGEYRVVLGGLPPGFFVKEARLGDEDLLNGPLRSTGPDSRPLDILISANVGAIDGIAADAAGQPMPGAQVVLIPSRNRERTELFRPVIADLNGRFTIPAVAPGEYTLAAWEAMEPNAFFDPNSIRQAEAGGKPVRVAESSTQTVNVTGIPVGAR